MLFTDSGMSNYRVVLKEDNSFDFYYYQPDGFSGLVPVNGYGSFSTNRINYFETVLYDWGSCSATVVGTK